MQNYQPLIDKIVAMVLKEMENSECKEKIVPHKKSMLVLSEKTDSLDAALGEEYGNDYDFTYHQSSTESPMGTFDVVYVDFLPYSRLGRLANAIATNSVEEWLLTHLGQSREVWINRINLPESNEMLCQILEQHKETLKMMGMVFLGTAEKKSKPISVDMTHKNLITEKDMRDLLDGSEVSVSSPIFTPLARDAAVIKQLKISKV